MKIKRFIKVILVGLSLELYLTVCFLLVLYYVQSNNDNLEASVIGFVADVLTAIYNFRLIKVYMFLLSKKSLINMALSEPYFYRSCFFSCMVISRVFVRPDASTR